MITWQKPWSLISIWYRDNSSYNGIFKFKFDVIVIGDSEVRRIMWPAPHFSDTWHGDAVTCSCIDTWHVIWWEWRWMGMQTPGTSYTTGCQGRWQARGQTPGQGRSVTARSSSMMTGRSATRHTTRCWRPPPHSVLQHPCSAAVSCMIEVDLNWCPV